MSTPKYSATSPNARSRGAASAGTGVPLSSCSSLRSTISIHGSMRAATSAPSSASLTPPLTISPSTVM